MAQLVELLPGMHKHLGSIPSTVQARLAVHVRYPRI